MRGGGAHVYAPWSVLKFLDAPNLGFSNYWMKSGGTLSLLEKYLHSHALKSPTEYDEEQAVSSDELYQPEHFVVIIRPLDVVIGLDVPTPTKSALAPLSFPFSSVRYCRCQGSCGDFNCVCLPSQCFQGMYAHTPPPGIRPGLSMTTRVFYCLSKI